MPDKPEPDPPRWEVRLIGPPLEQRWLSGLYRTGRHVIVDVDDSFVLQSEDFAVLDRAADVKARAEEIIQRMVGAARSRGGVSHRVAAGSVRRVGPEGTVEHMEALKDGAISGDFVEATARGIDGEIITPTPPPEIAFLEMADTDEDVATVLRLLAWETDWFSRYDVYEFIMRDLCPNPDAGNFTEMGRREAERLGFATFQELTDLARTANWWKTPGRPRHGAVPTRQEPENPLSREQADEIVRRLARRWIEERLADA